MSPRSLRAKLASLASVSQRDVTAIEVDGIRIEFAPAVSAESAAVAVTKAAPKSVVEKKLVPGTKFPDDRSRLNPIDLILTPPTIN